MKKNPTLRGGQAHLPDGQAHLPDGQNPGGYDGILADLSALIQEARTSAVRTINAVMTTAYWLIGRRIVEYNQAGEERAAYGEELLVRLASDLSRRFGRGFSRQNLQQMRQFYITYPASEICPTPSGKTEQACSGKSSRTPSGENPALAAGLSLRLIAERFILPWSAYVRLLSVKNESAHRFCEIKALAGEESR